jgi:hypothetical protein
MSSVNISSNTSQSNIGMGIIGAGQNVINEQEKKLK